MGLLDKLLGRDKKAATDVTDDASTRAEGAMHEQTAGAEDRAQQAEQMAEEQRDQAQTRADQEGM
jgi:uncharacterized protein YjbJ (UPF0337 family)